MKNFHPDDNCPVRNVLCRLGDKWSMLVLITLNANRTMRFCDIHKTIADISQRMLTVTLRTLETDGLVSRRVYAEVPPRVEYELTERGKSLIPHIEGLVDWALQQMPGIMESKGAKQALSKKNLKKNFLFICFC
ncbi:helix-turn-helix transcriptional regulator [Phocaeicola dorei]|nr:helix-turn-helix transcriptional regulator [Phocaeicola dorei]